VKTISLKKVSAIAVASLGIGVLTSISPASAVTETVTGTMSGPVRVSFTDSTRDSVAAAGFSVTTTAALTDASTDAQLTVTQAPTSGATMSVLCGGGTAVVDTLDTTGAKGADGAILGGNTTASTAFTCTVELTTGAASGTYKASLVLEDTAADADVVTVNISFTTTGKAATIKTDADAYTMPATTQTSSNTFLTYKTVAVELLDTAGVKTQAATGDSIVTSNTSATNIATKVLANNAASADLTISASDLNDGAHSFLIGSVTTTADSETITLTPGGVMPAQGVVAKKITASSAAYGTETAVKTALTSPSATTVVAAGTKAGSENSYIVEPSVRVHDLTSTGFVAGAAYRIGVKWTEAGGGSGSATVQDNVGNTTAASLTSGTVLYLYGIAPASGTVIVSVVITTPEAGETIEVNAESANTTYVGTTDALVTLTAPTYAITLTSPVVTPSIAVTASAITAAGVIKDSYGSLISGATVTATGVQTLSTGTASNLTGTATSSATGTFSIVLPAANTLTTSVALTVTAAKAGTSITNATATVNFNATGGATAMTYSLIGDEDTATTAATLPAVVIPYIGRATGVTDELYTVSTAANDDALAAADACVAVTVDSTPRGQIVATGTTGVLFYTSACTDAATHDVSAGKSTVTVAATGSANLWVTSTKTGLNTFTVTSGAVTKTFRFYGFNAVSAATAGDAVRNVGAPATAKAAVGGISYVTLTPTDAFGNVVKSAVASMSITAKAAGGVLLDGPVLSRTYTTTDSDGNILIGVIAGTVEGAATITITSSGAQLGAAAGAATGTTAGTNGLTASVSTVAIATTVGGASNPNSIASIAALIDALNAKIVALNALIAKIMRKLGVK